MFATKLQNQILGQNYRKYTGFLLTVFFFIWILNLLGMTPLGVNVTGNIAVTFALALVTFVIVQFSGNKDYWKHIFWMPGVPCSNEDHSCAN